MLLGQIFIIGLYLIQLLNLCLCLSKSCFKRFISNFQCIDSSVLLHVYFGVLSIYAVFGLVMLSLAAVLYSGSIDAAIFSWLSMNFS